MRYREGNVPKSMFLSWEDEINREKLLELCIQQLERLPKNLGMILQRLKIARLSNKEQQ